MNICIYQKFAAIISILTVLTVSEHSHITLAVYHAPSWSMCESHQVVGRKETCRAQSSAPFSGSTPENPLDGWEANDLLKMPQTGCRVFYCTQTWNYCYVCFCHQKMILAQRNIAVILERRSCNYRKFGNIETGTIGRNGGKPEIEIFGQ